MTWHLVHGYASGIVMRMLVINERNDKKNDMEETVDKIVRAAKEAVKDYDSDD